ncbi:MAG: tetratricopeptide repeat protein, partial [Gemmatimonadales bacterium]|nr:tetratricopeptide repeat protein [Gemmatimonadales bacterium]
MTARLAVLLCIGLTAVVSASRPPQLSPATGVVVESVGPPWSGSGKAGLRQGDVITAWGLPATEPAGTHAVASLTDWFEVEAEHGPRAPGVVVSFVRDERAQTATLAGGAWMLGVGPLLDREWRADHETALTHAARGEQVQAAAVWRDLAARAMQAVDPSLPAWFWLRAGGAETAARNAAGAVTAYGAARAAARERGQLFLEREALDGLGRAQQASQQPVAAEAAWSEAVALLQSERPNSPALVRALNALGAAQREFGRLDESERIYRRALERARVVAPGSIVEVASLGGLSVTLRRRGDRAGAERTLDEAAAILEQFPDHPDRIANAGNRGILLVEQNRLAEGQQQLERAEALDRARGTPADALALAHHANLGVVAAQRGDFAQAEAYFRSFLGAAERTSMNPLERVRGLNNLAIISLERGDGERALTSFEAAQALAAKAAPGSPTLADALGNLGSARARTGDLAGSDTAYEAALRIREAVSPDEPAIAAILWSLAANAERRGDLDGASRYAARAVAHIDRTAPGGLSAARAYHVAARVALARGDLAEARRSQERGLAIARDLAPGSRLEVSALATLARVDVRERRLEAAVTRYAEAVAALAIQVRRL